MAESIKSRLEDISRSVVELLGYEMVDLEFVKERDRWVLRVFIDQNGGIGLDDCEKVSKALSETLDEGDPIPHAYVLEVSSPGLDRPLKSEGDFDRFKGRQVMVKTLSPVNGRKRIKGCLKGLSDGEIVVAVEDQEYRIPRNLASSVRLVPEY